MKRAFIIMLSLLLLINIIGGCSVKDNGDDDNTPEITGAGTSTPESPSGSNKQERVEITRDLTPAEIEAWALGCSAVPAISDRMYGCEPYKFGMFNNDVVSATIAQLMLSSSWGCEDRDSLLKTIDSLIDNGHNKAFVEESTFVLSLSDSDYDRLLSEVDEVGAFMVPFIKEIAEKWGDKEVKAWDWFRVIHLAGWGYVAEFVDRNEAYSLMENAILRLRSTFTSWDEAVENFLDGYAWWTQTDVENDDEEGEYSIRVSIYEIFKDEISLFNPTVWASEFIQAPASGFTYDDNGDGTCTVTGFYGEPYDNLVIPDKINDLTVTAIGDAIYDFRDFTGFYGTLTLPSTITSIGLSAFENCNFSGTIVIPEGVTEIKVNAFGDCYDISQADFLGDVPAIFDSSVFRGCAEEFHITYDPAKSGWTTPEWNGHPSFPR